MLSRRLSLEGRLKARTEVSEGCWEWRGAISNKGYGVLTFKGKQVLVHRAMYELALGPIPTGLFVCHHCDNRKCLRPEHLFVGSQRDNIADMMSKGRGGGQFKKGHTVSWSLDQDRRRAIAETISRRNSGEGNPAAKLNAAQVNEIRTLLSGEPRAKLKELAHRFGVSASLVSMIRKGKVWAVA